MNHSIIHPRNVYQAYILFFRNIYTGVEVGEGREGEIEKRGFTYII